MNFFFLKLGEGGDVPDREDTTGLSDIGLLLHTTDSLLEEGRDLGGRGLGLSSVVTDLLGGDGGDGSASLDAAEFCQYHNRPTKNVSKRGRKGNEIIEKTIMKPIEMR